jgi:60 kDa SS-A/Ro ribonucleoprotein
MGPYMGKSRDPLTNINTLQTPQTQPVPGRTDLVKNNAGGYVFKKSDWTQLEDFLILGTTGGTHYLDEDKLTLDNVNVVFDLAKTRGAEVVERVIELSASIPVRVPSNKGCLFALAAVSAMGDAEGVQAVKRALPQVARTTDHLSTFFGYRKQLKGKVTARGTAPVTSRAYRSTLASWFLEADPEDVAFRACKARQRKTPAGEAFDLTDAVRLAHPKAVTTSQKFLLEWLAGKISDDEAAKSLTSVAKFVNAKAVLTDNEAIYAVNTLRVPWEFLPSERLASPAVWEALTETVGITALIRNLARMTRIGTLAPFASANATVIRRLTDVDQLTKGRVHPMTVYLALRVYASGFSQPNPKAPPQSWTPVGSILDASEEAYELSFGHVEPSGRKMLIAVDSSGSMGYSQVSHSGSDLGQAYHVANAAALTLQRIEGDNAVVIDVDTAVHSSRITKRTRLAEVQRGNPSGGGTNMALPFDHALMVKANVDGFVIITDNETWAGRSHPFQSLAAYRNVINQNARAVVVTMVPNGYGILDQNDPGVMQMAGMDASLPLAVTGFMRDNE